MDWTKIKTKHFLFTDWTASQVGTLATLLCLTAHLERLPRHAEMIQQVHYKQLKSVQRKLNEDSTSLQSVLNKVIEDVLKVEADRILNRNRQTDYRSKRKNDNGLHNVHVTQQRRGEERRGDIKEATPSATKFNDLTKKTTKNVGTEDPKQVNLRKIEVRCGGQVLGEGAKHKMYNRLIKMFQNRGWKPDMIKSVMVAAAGRIKEKNLEGQLYPYYERALAKYINENAEILAASNK